MNEAKTFESVEEYAAKVQRETHTVLSRLVFGHLDEAKAMVAALCTKAAGIVQAAKMKREVEAGNFDLSTLPTPKALTPEEDVESPFYEVQARRCLCTARTHGGPQREKRT